MNPLIAATAADTISKGIENGNVEKLANTAMKPFKTMLIVVAVAIAGYFIYKAVKNAIAKAKATANNNQDIISNPTTPAQIESNRLARARQYATRLRTAFNPSGYSWLINTDFTNLTSVFSVADEMKANGVPFSYVANAYYAAYNDDLAKRLQFELNSSELTKFYSKAGMNGFNGLNGPKNNLKSKPVYYAY